MLVSVSIRGGGAYYSFARLTHEYGFGSDIALESGYLCVGFAGFDYGMLLNLGNVPLQQVSLDTPATAYLASYSPPRSDKKFSTPAVARVTTLN